jgi:anthranilate synthase component 1
MIYPSLDEAKSISKEYSVLPITFEMLSDIITPIGLLKKLREKSKKCYLLESVEGGEKWGRYSFLGFDPTLSVRLRDGEVTLQNGKKETRRTDDPNAVLGEILSAYKSPRLPSLPPFTGGLVGYFAYDYIQYNEKSLKFTQNDPVGFDDFYLMLFDKVIVFDHLRQKLVIIINIQTGRLQENYRAATDEIAAIEQIIRDKKDPAAAPARLLSDFRPLFSKKAYCEMVSRTKKHIVEGDIFQAVISNRMEADFEGSLLSAYRILRTVNPSPYMFYLGMEDTEIAGASPETLISLKDGILETFPIAGTCPRGKTEEEDEALIALLLADEKELSEHNMLVDLGRNDVGRISEFGSVKVSDYQKVMRFSHVSHITTKVGGRLKTGLGPLNAVASMLPAGTLSGAPKIRACEIINNLENVKRGVYGGAIGYIDFAGNMDLCIAIRMAVKKDGKVYVQAGAGIVADSVPDKEYEECLSKARAMAGALRASGEVEA